MSNVDCIGAPISIRLFGLTESIRSWLYESGVDGQERGQEHCCYITKNLSHIKFSMLEYHHIHQGWYLIRLERFSIGTSKQIRTWFLN